MKLWCLAGALSILILTPAMALASSPIHELSFREQVDMAGAIFAGTVSEITPVSQKSNAIVRVVFKLARFAKGRPLPDGVTQLTIAAGSEISYVGKPHFVVGERYIVLTTEDMGSKENWYLPLVGMDRGMFHVVKDENSGELAVTVQEYPIARFEGEELVLASKDPSDEDYAPRVTEEEFMEVIRVMTQEKR